MLQFAKHGLRYASELVGNARGLAGSLRTASPDQQVSGYLAKNRIYPSSAMALLGLMFYDMAVGSERKKHERELVGRTASRIILLTDIIDDVIDRRPTGLDYKFDFLDKAKSDLFGYSSNSSEDLQEESSFALARAVYSDFLSRYQDRRLENIFDELVSVVKRQFTETGACELLRIAKTIGSCCTDSAAVLTEIVTGEKYFHVRESARRMGEYCAMLDNWYEWMKIWLKA